MAQIEAVDAAQWQRVRTVRLRALRDTPDAFWATAQEEAAIPPEGWRRRLQRPDAVTFIARDRAADVGIVVGGPDYEDPRRVALYGLWVAPEARGRGVGRALVAAVLSWARAAGYRTLRLEVTDSPAARRLYEQAGFTATGRASTFPAPRDHIRATELRADL